MRVIVFDQELHEPLTVVEVPEWLAEQAKTGCAVVLPVVAEISAAEWRTADPPETAEFRRVVLRFERVQRNGETLFWYAYADNPATALLLRCAFLPGQVGEVQRREELAYTKALMHMLGAR